jgi:integrase
MKDLTAREVANLKTPGTHRASRNLYVQNEPAADGDVSRSWLLRYTLNGRAREMGLGALDLVTLAEAREKVLAGRKLLLEGVDPLEARKAERMQALLAAVSTMTFQECGNAYIAAHEPGWRNPKHRQQWRNTLGTYVYPVVGELPVQAADTAIVMKILEPIWTAKPETAGRVRGRIESILDWATVRQFRTGDNPARWRGHLEKLLPAKSAVRVVKHHAALPYVEAPAFMAAVREQDGIAARALEITILTVLRTGGAIGARWPEFDLQEKVWTVPKDRMKWKPGQTPRDHRVPLCDRAIEILAALPREKGSDFVFIGGRAGKPISNMAMLKLLARMGRDDLTVHGFRSTFKDWAAETTGHTDIVVEMALAHAVGDKVEAAYRRGDLFQKRRRLMDDWARFCASPPRGAAVVDLQTRRG